MFKEKSKAVFLDRDGTINKDFGYVFELNKLKLLPQTIEALHIFQDAGFLLIVITNQSGVGRGICSKEDVLLFNEKLKEILVEHNILITDFFVCYHAPEEHCSCRKPSPYLLNEAVLKYNIDKDRSFMLGDKKSDVLAGESAFISSFLITEEHSLYYWANKLKISNGLY